MFVTWRLYGSLPRSFRVQLEESPGERFYAVDRVLDNPRSGPLWLKEPSIAEVIVESLRYGSQTLGQYDLHAFVVMANHVHVLLTPYVEIAKITRGIKGSTACRANRILGRAGQPFWQPESFDHWLRKLQFGRTIRYIERNPVQAGLVANDQEWTWSSAHPRYRLMVVERKASVAEPGRAGAR